MPRGGFAQRFEQAQQRRNEIANEPEQPRYEGAVRRSMQRRQPQVEHTDPTRPFTGTPEIESTQRPVYNPEDSTRFHNETGTVGYMGRSQVPPVQGPPRRPRPPSPPITSSATPIGNLKNQVAFSNQYSDEAARELHNTPTWGRYGSLWSDSVPMGRNPRLTGFFGVGGAYTPGEGNIHLNALGTKNTLDNQDTLAHEFAHRWRDKRMEPAVKQEWEEKAADLASPYARFMMKVHHQPGPSELYAYQAERGPHSIDPDIRDRYYQGMYQDDLGEPPPPGLPISAFEYPDEYSQGWSTEYWVNPENVWGYYSDGEKIMESTLDRRWPKLSYYTGEGRVPPGQPSGPPPPLPAVRPMATPVMDLKRETANYWDFSPTARTMLYDTPTLVNWRGYDHKPPDEPQGWANSGRTDEGPQIMVQEPMDLPPLQPGMYGYDRPSMGAGTLAHEFGHVWDFSQMPEHVHDEWNRGGWLDSPIWGPGVGAQFRGDYNTGEWSQDDWNLHEGETYANTIMNYPGGRGLPTYYRDKYFAGLFNDSAPRFQEPYYGGPPPASDIIRERVPHERWPSASGAMG